MVTLSSFFERYRFFYSLVVVLLSSLLAIVYAGLFLMNINVINTVTIQDGYIAVFVVASCVCIAYGVMRGVWSLVPCGYHEADFVLADDFSIHDAQPLHKAMIPCSLLYSFVVGCIALVFHLSALKFFKLPLTVALLVQIAVIAPLLHGILIWFFIRWFVVRYICYLGNKVPHTVVLTRYLKYYHLLPETVIFFVFGFVINAPIGESLMMGEGIVHQVINAVILTIVLSGIAIVVAKIGNRRFLLGDVCSNFFEFVSVDEKQTVPQMLQARSFLSLFLLLGSSSIIVILFILLLGISKTIMWSPAYILLITAVASIVFAFVRMDNLQKNFVEVYTLYSGTCQ